MGLKLIGVIGGGHPEARHLQVAREVGRRIAEAGAALICGGLTGVMEAACQGAKEAGGLTVGVLPTLDKGDANPYVDVAIATGMSTARNVIIVRSSDALIAIDGSYGTLSEIAHAFEQGLPVLALESWDMGSAGVPAELYEVVPDPATAVARALEIADDDAHRPIPFGPK